MAEFITLVNIGAAGLAYYATVINNKEKFNG